MQTAIQKLNEGLDESGFQLSSGQQLRIFERKMIEFAKLHVQQALKAASEKAEIATEYDNPFNLSMGHSYIVDRDSILNAYSLDNIK